MFINIWPCGAMVTRNPFKVESSDRNRARLHLSMETKFYGNRFLGYPYLQIE